MSALFAKARESFLCGRIDWMKNTIRAAVCKGGVNLEKDEFLSDVATICQSAPFTNKSCKDGAAAAANITFDKVDGSAAGLVIFQDTGSPATSRLIAHIDKLGYGKFPIATGGGDLQVVWDDGPNRIFRL